MSSMMQARPPIGDPLVLYRILHFVNAWFALAVLGLYIVAFLLALSMMFVFPQITLLLFFMGLAGLGVAVILGKTISGMSHSLVRHALAAGTCPMCRRPGGSMAPENEIWRCAHCGAAFQRSGEELTPQPALGSDAS